MRITRTLTTAAALIGVVAALTVATDGAGAATDTIPHFTGTAGGTQVSLVSGAVTSGLTAASGIDTLTVGAGSTNSAATATVQGLIDAGVVTSSVQSSAVSGGFAITSHAKTTGLSLLGGLITADAVDTTSTATMVNGKGTAAISTTFVNLKIAQVKLPVTIGRNLTVTIPGIARVTLNYSAAKAAPNSIITSGAGALITLLQGAGNAPTNSTVLLNPISAAIGLVGSGYRILAGYGYGSRVNAKVTQAIQLQVGQTGATSVPPTGTGGRVVTNSTVAGNLPHLVSVDAVSSSASGVASDTHSYATETVDVTGVNLLNGLITADALKGSAHAEYTAGGTAFTTHSTQLVNLKVAGKSIPVNVSPNTVIQVANVGNVTINGQYASGGTTLVRMIDVTLTTGAYGLPAGAQIEVGEAYAAVHA